MNRKLISLLPALLVLCALTASCGGGSSTSTPTSAGPTGTAGTSDAEVESFMRHVADLYNGGQIDDFLALFTDQGVVQFAGDDPSTSADQARSDIKQGAQAGGTVNIRAFQNEQVSGDTASFNLETTQGHSVVLETFTLKLVNGNWLIDGYKQISPSIPAGTRTVEVDASEFKYDFDPSQMTDGDFAIAFKNTGQQAHELQILKIDEGADLQATVNDLLNSGGPSDLPSEIQTYIGGSFSQAGETTNIVFAQPLEKGRYLMVSLISDVSDPNLAPEATKGMFAEFTVN